MNSIKTFLIKEDFFGTSEKTKKGLEKTMGGEVLELESEKLIRKGMQQALVRKQSER